MNANQIALASRSFFQPLPRKVQTPVATHGVKALAFATREEQDEAAAKDEADKLAKREAAKAERKAARSHSLTVALHNASVKATLSASVADQARSILAERKMKAASKVESLGETEVPAKAKRVKIVDPASIGLTKEQYIALVQADVKRYMRFVSENSLIAQIKKFHAGLAGTGFVLGLPCEVAREGTSLVRSLVLAFFAGTEDAMADDDCWTDEDRANAKDALANVKSNRDRLSILLGYMGVIATETMLDAAIMECYETEHALMADAL